MSGHFGRILLDGRDIDPADRILGEVFVEGFGVSVSKKSERLVVKRKGEVIFERPFFEVERVIVSTEGATVSAAAIHECVKQGIPVGTRNDHRAKCQVGLGYEGESVVTITRHDDHGEENRCA